MKIVWPDLNSEEISFSDIFSRSDKTLLYFYPKDDTPGCTIEAIDFSQNMDFFLSKWIQIVWVSKDNEKSHCKFIIKQNLKVHLISDEELELHKKFDTRQEKSMYGKKYFGTVRSTFLLNSKWDILQSWKNVNAKWHVEEVMGSL